jgi:hypothetical protein
MNKNHGLTAGAVVLTGLTGFLLRLLAMIAGGSGSAERQGVAAAKAGTLTNLSRGEGPWIASCDYWAAVRPETDDKTERMRVSMKVDLDGSSFTSSSTAAEADAVSCPGGSDRWGIPDAPPPSKQVEAGPRTVTETPQITAIIATVPDPTREHLALDFDHTIDGLLQAANDNGYLESYSWLPWKSPGEASETLELATTEQDQLQEIERERKRLKEPGLIVLKKYDKGEKYYKALYLFLVGNTPMEGVEGDQLANALKYEAELQNTAREGVCFRPSVVKTDDLCNMAAIPGKASPKGAPADSSAEPPPPFEPSPYSLTIIGPNFSGAAGSLRALLDKAAHGDPSQKVFPSGVKEINVFAEIGSEAATASFPVSHLINFVSFAGNAKFETAQLKKDCDKGDHPVVLNDIRTVVLIEDNTVYGTSQELTTNGTSQQAPTPGMSTQSRTKDKPCPNWSIIKYPRGISLLRNAHEEESSHSSQENGEAPSPYLHMSLADRSDKGTIPQFSPQTATTQEAQLVSITQQLQRFRAQLIVLGSSNALDTIFLARFLHRTFPDARLVQFGADLLVERDTDNQPLVGAVSIDAYPLLGPMPSDLKLGSARRPFASTITESVYNAASFALWNEEKETSEPPEPHLANYRNIFAPKVLKPDSSDKREMYPSLWAMAVGRDAYYPIGLLEPCGSDSEEILPLLHAGSKHVENCPNVDWAKRADDGSHRRYDVERVLWPLKGDPTDTIRFAFDPTLWWYYLCAAICVACIAHVICMLFASFSSPAMRDLAIDEMNNPCRRSVFIHIGSVMLFCMAFVVGYPIFPALHLVIPNPAAPWFGSAAIFAGLVALFVSFYRAVPHVWRNDIRARKTFPYRPTYVYLAVHGIAFIAMVAIPVLWFRSCEETQNHVGLFFCYRCLNPLSGVSPLLPILLLLLGWYLWSIIQTRRLRFSETTRPQIPGRLESKKSPFYVSDEELTTEQDLASEEDGTDPPLYLNLTCLFITPHVLRHISGEKLKGWQIWTLLTLVYGGLISLSIFVIHPNAMERLLNNKGRIVHSITVYELLFGMLFFPLLLIALTGFLRMAVTWASLRCQLLRPLEFCPIRFAFGRMSTVGWISMMRQSDYLERQRERARSLESMRQLARSQDIHEDLRNVLDDCYQRAVVHHDNLDLLIHKPKQHIQDADDEKAAARAFRKDQDFPKAKFQDKARMFYYLERDFAAFAQHLLKFVLIPYWNDRRAEVVESEERETTHARRLVPGKEENLEYAIHPGLTREPPHSICLAEEFVAIRYVSLIRAVLVNIRHLLTFVSFAWVLSMIAWNSYPFRPRQTVDVIFTLLFVTLGVGAIWVFSQMYRDVLLSRITRTEGNELGIEFYVRIAMFGAIPLMTWLAYQFPAVGAVVLKYLQPGIEAAK